MFASVGRTTVQAFSRRPVTAKGSFSTPGQAKWDLRLKKCHWDGFFSEHFGFALSSFHQSSVTISIYTLPFLEV